MFPFLHAHERTAGSGRRGLDAEKELSLKCTNESATESAKKVAMRLWSSVNRSRNSSRTEYCSDRERANRQLGEFVARD
jgi:hypothetical protein